MSDGTNDSGFETTLKIELTGKFGLPEVRRQQEF